MCSVSTPHQRLILKLKSHGMGISIINWIEQWLTDRKQRVVVDGEVSSWKSVLSGVPQGPVIGPVLFLVYINYLEEGVTGSILKFADETKLFRKTKEIGDKQNVQDDIDKLVKWSEKWQMLFNFGKCKCLHTGPGNTDMDYEMGGTILSKTVKEKDLGVTNAKMKVSEQCRIAASKDNQVLGMIRRNITFNEKSLIVPLYKAIVRPHLEYCMRTFAYLCRSYPCPGSIAMIAFRHPSRFWASFGSSWCCFRSLRTRSIHLSLGLPRGLFPPTFIVVTCFATFVSSLLITWPYHESRFWATCVVISLTIASLLNFSFLIRSFLVLP